MNMWYRYYKYTIKVPDKQLIDWNEDIRYFNVRRYMYLKVVHSNRLNGGQGYSSRLIPAQLLPWNNPPKKVK